MDRVLTSDTEQKVTTTLWEIGGKKSGQQESIKR